MRPGLSRIGAFALVGGAATVIYATLAWAGAALGLPMPLASGLAYGLAALWSFCGHRALTFRGTHPHPLARTRFLALTLSGYGIAFAVPAFLPDAPGGPALSILLTCLAVPLANYLVLSRCVFRERGPA